MNIDDLPSDLQMALGGLLFGYPVESEVIQQLKDLGLVTQEGQVKPEVQAELLDDIPPSACPPLNFDQIADFLNSPTD